MSLKNDSIKPKAAFEIFNRMLEKHNAIAQIYLNELSESSIIASIPLPFEYGSHQVIVDKAILDFSIEIYLTNSELETFEISLTIKLLNGCLKNINIEFILSFNNWSKENYVLIPGAVYNGNRYEVNPSKYPPIQDNPDYMGVNAPTLITDIPHLESFGDSSIEFHAGDMATPAVGFRDCNTKKGFFILTDQSNNHIENGLALYENSDKNIATLKIANPGVKHQKNYAHCRDREHSITTKFISEDRGIDLESGDSINLKLRAYSFDCPCIQNLFDVFFDIRKDRSIENTREVMPFSAAWKEIEDEFNTNKWIASGGFYSMADRLGKPAFLLGWIGMMMYPFIINGSLLSIERSKENIEFIISKTQAPTGFYYGSANEDQPVGDNFNDRNKKYWCLLRKNADALLYLAKCILWLKSEEKLHRISVWKVSFRKCADAFVGLWKRYGQLGQFVDIEKGKILVGGSGSAAMAAGALAICSVVYKEKLYIDTAMEIGEYYYQHFVKKGVTNGGPGEILQAPDSESSYAMLESFVMLYETGGDKIWLTRSEEMAKQFSSWCVSYDYEFPPMSLFARLKMNTMGTVIANAQNKHSAPGICTHSGSALLRLFLYTGNKKYLELIKDIAHSITQYVSTLERPIISGDGKKQLPGWINERVNMSDWEGNKKIGEIFYGDCWCSVSMLMTYTEIPGLILQPDIGMVYAIDHIKAEVIENESGKKLVKICNPTSSIANVKVLCRNSFDREPVFMENLIKEYITIQIKPKSSMIFEY